MRGVPCADRRADACLARARRAGRPRSIPGFRRPAVRPDRATGSDVILARLAAIIHRRAANIWSLVRSLVVEAPARGRGRRNRAGGRLVIVYADPANAQDAGFTPAESPPIPGRR